MQNQKGFTLIELMIVVAIIAILAAIAISAYSDYVIRSQISEGAALSDGMKTAVAEFYNNNGRFSANGNVSFGLSAPTSIQGTYVASVGVGATGPCRMATNTPTASTAGSLVTIWSST